MCTNTSYKTLSLIEIKISSDLKLKEKLKKRKNLSSTFIFSIKLLYFASINLLKSSEFNILSRSNKQSEKNSLEIFFTNIRIKLYLKIVRYFYDVSCAINIVH